MAGTSPNIERLKFLHDAADHLSVSLQRVLHVALQMRAPRCWQPVTEATERGRACLLHAYCHVHAVALGDGQPIPVVPQHGGQGAIPEQPNPRVHRI
eukprot:6492212-Amphidinium_carterae.7